MIQIQYFSENLKWLVDVDNVVLTALLSRIPSCRKSSINVSCCYSFNKNLTTHLRDTLMIEWIHTSKCDSLKAMNEWMARRNWEAEDWGQRDRREGGGRLSVFMGMPFPSSESLPGGAFPGQLPPALITVAHLSGALWSAALWSAIK